MLKNRYDAVIIGGGAAGLMVAAQLSDGGKSVLLLEKMEKPARKVRITGKGRCNLTNDCTLEQFSAKIKQGDEFMQPSLQMFTPQDCVSFFEKCGVSLTVERGGRVFPTSMRAGDIADSIERFAKSRGAQIICNAKVESLLAKNNHIEGVVATILGKEESIYANTVVVATGGASYPSTGSTGDGYNLCHKLGHYIEPIRPSLTPLKIVCRNLNELDRLNLKNINLSLIVDGEKVCEEFGELEFFDYGIGGATTLRMSRRAVDALIEERKVELLIDLKPALSAVKLEGRFSRELESDSNMTIGSFLRKLMPKQLVTTFGEQLKLPLSKKCNLLGKRDVEKIVKLVKNMRFAVSDYCDFSKAIVTAGGVSTQEVNMYTMESEIARNVFVVGELLDVDADTGGYNLQIAFSTAFAAANAIINS